ncbi:MAG: hypothetical protein ACI4OL_06090 [Gemmiger sp.]
MRCRVCAILALGLALTGCSAGGEVDNLLRAPQLSGETSAVQRALNSYLGESANLKYPSSGDFLSPFLFGDWDGDGVREAAVLYTSDKSGPNVWLAVLEPDEDGTWKVTGTAEGLSDSVEVVSYASLRDAESQQLLVGYGSAPGDQYLAVYLYDGQTLQPVIKQAYTEMLLADITGKGTTQDLILALPTETENGGINLQLLTNYEGLFKSAQTLSVGAGVYSGCAALHAGVGRDGGAYLVVDGYTGGSGGYLASSIIIYDNETGYLTSYLPPNVTDMYHNTLRYDDLLFSADIDSDGTVDIPVEVDDGGELRAPLDKRLRFVLWKDYVGARGGSAVFGVYDSEYRFFLPLPESLHGSVCIKENMAGTGWLVCDAAGDTAYCELRVVSQAKAQSSEFHRIANIGAQQLQVRVITPYYGLELQKILDNTIVMES